MDVALSEQTPGEARARLEGLFVRSDMARNDFERPFIGIVGNGAPEVLIAASGATPIHLNLSVSNTDGTGAINAVIEPFVDHEVRTFLLRFAQGAFDDLAGIVFVRDDAAALTAYQYATEWVRQGRVDAPKPPLFLFNLVHGATQAIAAFNVTQTEKLRRFLTGVGLKDLSPETLVKAAGDGKRRQEALDALALRSADRRAMVWRNAGRFMPAERHAAFLERAIKEVDFEPSSRPRLGVVGSPLVSQAAYDAFARHGDVIADLHPFGQVWPGPWEQEADVARMIVTLASDPFCPRVSPPHRHRQALVDRLVSARCDFVLCQLAQTDDTFGWEIPSLSRTLADHRIGFVNLGFRDPEPDPTWLDRADTLIAKALEVPA